MLKSAQPSKLFTYPINNIDIPGLAILTMQVETPTHLIYIFMKNIFELATISITFSFKRCCLYSCVIK